ncbi:hypothetical protein M8C21_001106, partial [Ambrosia artemisiifolia]
FVNFTDIMTKNVPPIRKETEFALAALMEIPTQYKATVELNMLGEELCIDTGKGKDDIEIGTCNLKLVYSRSEGKLYNYVNTRSSIKASLKQSYSFYAGFDGTTGLQASGAYIFPSSEIYRLALKS